MAQRKILTLVLVHDHPRILLGMKKRGFGAGRFNGFGGKVEKNETVEQAALRELEEESKVKVEQLEKHGVIEFEFKGNPEILEVHVFKGRRALGEPQESEEMKPQWFYVDEIPFKEMWPDDIYWIPLFLKGKKFKGRFLFGPGDSILEKKIDIVERL